MKLSARLGNTLSHKPTKFRSKLLSFGLGRGPWSGKMAQNWGFRRRKPPLLHTLALPQGWAGVAMENFVPHIEPCQEQLANPALPTWLGRGGL